MEREPSELTPDCFAWYRPLGAASIAVLQPIFGPRHVLSLVGVLQVPAGLITAIVFYLWVSAFPFKLLVARDERR